ncbi:hypothetical protein BS47DRAFT_1398999 [Hydnum rufescens UP504]|uniref:ATP11-domain-containing protein n=1 Tax=Hydnum rufescens UP504 TaxID=1448309 RepID=A0A9P6AJP3_9AGAM|nr:hypothetical protein BS47DRAFT_1398999 [Hydnum rufescens UP504]
MIARHSTFTIRAFASSAAAAGAKADGAGGAKLALNEGVSDLEQLKGKLAPSPAAPPEKLGSLAPSSSVRPASTQKDASLPSRKKWTRKDSSPIKPLSALLNVPKIMETPHTAEEVSSLWTLYHASLSHVRAATTTRRLTRRGIGTGDGGGASGGATEFFFMEWGFHSPPEHPSRVDPLADPFAVVGATTNAALARARLPPPPPPPPAEYKLRGSFAQPRLVVTHHTDLADSHAIVLLRGEITASPSGGFQLSQMDAQLLALAVQKFYLPGGTPQSENDFQILRTFHEAQDQFDYKKLLATHRK